MPDQKRSVLIFVVLAIKICQMVLIYAVLTYDLNGKLSLLDKAKYIIFLVLYCCCIMLPLLLCELKTAMKWEISFSTATNVLYFLHVFSRFHSSNIQENDDHLDEEEHKWFQNGTSCKEINTLKNKGVSSKYLLELFSFILEGLLLVISFWTFLEISQPDKESLVVNVKRSDVEADNDNENETTVSSVEFVAHAVEPVHAVKPKTAVQLSPVYDTPQNTDVQLSPVYDTLQKTAVQLSPIYDTVCDSLRKPAVQLSPVYDTVYGALQPKRKLLGLKSQAAILETSFPYLKYHRIPYQTHIEDEDEILETQV